MEALNVNKISLYTEEEVLVIRVSCRTPAAAAAAYRNLVARARKENKVDLSLEMKEVFVFG